MANLSSKTGTITTPVQAQLSLANNAATSIQDMSAYDSQEVTGFVYVDATADLRCSFKVMVVKNGAGTYEVASTDLSGDNFSSAPMVSFSMSGSILQATLPNVTGFASAYLRYQLSAPYLGGNYPLTVSARQVAGDVSGVAVPAGYIGEVIRTTAMTGTALATSATDVTGSSLPLTAGIWMLCYTVNGEVTTGTSSGNTSYIDLAVYTSGNVLVAATESRLLVKTTAAVANVIQATMSGSTVINISAPTTYKLRGTRTDAAGTGAATINNIPTTGFYAVRIA